MNNIIHIKHNKKDNKICMLIILAFIFFIFPSNVFAWATVSGYRIDTFGITNYSDIAKSVQNDSIFWFHNINNETGINGLKLWMTFTEPSGSTTPDLSGNGNIGTINGSVRNNSTSFFGNAMDFDGEGDNITIAYSDSLSLLNDFTITGWIKWVGNGTDGGTGWNRVISGGENYVIERNISDNTLTFAFYDGSTWLLTTTTSPLERNKWIHFAVVWNDTSNTSYIYINGNLNKNVTWGTSQPTASTSPKVIIGANETGNTKVWNGSIDEIAIFNRSLTASEILEIYLRRNATLQKNYVLNMSNVSMADKTIFYAEQNATLNLQGNNSVWCYGECNWTAGGTHIYFSNNTKISLGYNDTISSGKFYFDGNRSANLGKLIITTVGPVTRGWGGVIACSNDYGTSAGGGFGGDFCPIGTFNEVNVTNMGGYVYKSNNWQGWIYRINPSNSIFNCTVEGFTGNASAVFDASEVINVTIDKRLCGGKGYAQGSGNITQNVYNLTVWARIAYAATQSDSDITNYINITNSYLNGTDCDYYQWSNGGYENRVIIRNSTIANKNICLPTLTPNGKKSFIISLSDGGNNSDDVYIWGNYTVLFSQTFGGGNVFPYDTSGITHNIVNLYLGNNTIINVPAGYELNIFGNPTTMSTVKYHNSNSQGTEKPYIIFNGGTGKINYTTIEGLSDETSGNIYNVPDAMLILKGVSNMIINNSIFRASNSSGIVLSGTTNSVLNNNTIVNNYLSGLLIVDSSSNNNITNNIVNNNSNYGIWLDSSSNTLTNNTANNNQYGIYLYSSSNNNQLTNNTANNNTNSGIYLWSSISNTLRNNIANNNQYGIYLYSRSNDNQLINNTANNNQYGIYLYSSSNDNLLINNTANNNIRYGIWLISSSFNILTNNTANNNTYGIYLYSSSNNNQLTNNTANNNSYGIWLESSTYNTLTNNTANNNTNSGINLESDSNKNTITNNIVNNNNYGIHLSSSSSNAVSNNTANNNIRYGIWLQDSSSNTLTNNTAQENGEYDLYLSASTDNYCNNLITNTTGSGGRPILYYNNLVTLQNQVLSELVLCNADNSDITNVTIDGSPTLKNNGLVAIRVDGSNLIDINSSNNNVGINFFLGSNNAITNNIVNNNNYGIHLSSSSSNAVSNNIANNNTYGIYLYSSSNDNQLINNTANNNQYGIYLYSSSNNNQLTNNTANNNTNSGIYLWSSISNTLSNNIANNNQYGIYLNSSSNNQLTNNTANNKNYGIVLTASNSNTLTNNTANNNNQYGIWLQESNSTTLTNNIVNNNQNGIFYSSSNNNQLINNTANNNTNSGIYLYWSTSNTLSNNIVNNNRNGIYLYSRSNDNQLINNTANNNNQYGIWFQASNYNTLTNNIVNNNTYGIYLYSSSNDNQLINNTANNNNYYGILLTVSSSRNTLTNNTANNNTYGISLYSSSNYNQLTNNTANNNTNSGIYLWSSISNTLSNNIANNNTYGIYLYSSSNNNQLTNNTANNNTNIGIVLENSNSNTLTNNTANNNINGIYFYNSKNNILITNTILNSTQSDFYVDIDSTDNIIHNTTLNNSIISFTGEGISLKSSSPIGSIPSGYRSLGKYVNITNLSAAGSWIFLNITYSDSDVVGMNENKLSIWRYNSSAWNNWTGVNGVNTSGKYVYANLTNFSIFDVMGLDDIAPSITIASPKLGVYSSNSVALEVSATEPVSAWWYSLDGGPNTRFTPNITLSGLSNGQHTLIVYANDSVGNIASASVEFVVNVYTPPQTDGGGGGTGGGGGGALPITNVTEETKTIAVITAGARTNVTITNAATLGIKTISISVKNTVNNVQLTISKTTHPTDAAEVISPLNGKVYKYIKITKSNMQDEDVSSLTISIQVEKSWLTNNNIDEDKVALYRYNTSSNTWTKLLTTKTTSDENYVYYDAQSPGLSIFAIAGELKQAVAPQEETPTTPPEKQPSAPQEPQPSAPQETQPSMPTAPTDYTWLIIIAVIIIIAAVGYYLYSKGYFGKKKQDETTLTDSGEQPIYGFDIT